MAVASQAEASSTRKSSSPEAQRRSGKRVTKRASSHGENDPVAQQSNFISLDQHSPGEEQGQPSDAAADTILPSLDTADEDDDPVTSEYSVYISPEVSWNPSAHITIPDDDEAAPAPPPRNDLLLLQFPTRRRTEPYNSENTPVALRVKPRNGFLELDVPLHRGPNYDARKAKRWGDAMRATGTGKGRGAFGMANGFMNNPAPQSKDENDMDVDEDDELPCQTLGGQLSTPAKGLPRYMLGTFRGSELHFTPVTGMAQLRPQHHHLDAASHQARGGSRATGPDAAPSRTGAGPRMLAISHKQPPPGGGGGVESTGTANVKELLLAVAEEEWSELDYFEEEHQNSYDAFKQYAFLSGVERDQLMAEWSSDQYLDKIGGGSDRAKAGTAAVKRDRRRRGRAAEKLKAAAAANGSAVPVEVSSGSDEASMDEDEDEDENPSADTGDVG